MMDDVVQGCKPDLTDTEIGMSVFGGSLFVLAVVDMISQQILISSKVLIQKTEYYWQ